MKKAIEIYEGYLDQVVELPDELRLEEEILAFWRDRKDADAFLDRGNLFTEQYTLSFQNDPQSALLIGISAYEEALRFYSAERAPLDYAGTQNNLGTAYGALAGYQEPTENLQRAIQAYTEALRFYSAQWAPLQYAATQEKLAVTYAHLGARLRYSNRLEDAISLFENSHGLFPRIVTALHLGGTFKQLGNADLSQRYLEEGRRLVEKDDWYNLACLESLAGNLELALEYLTKATENKDFDRAWAWEDPDLEILRSDARFVDIIGVKPS